MRYLERAAPRDAVKVVTVAETALILGDVDRGLEVVERAISISPDGAAAHLYKVELLLIDGRTAAALEALNDWPEPEGDADFGIRFIHRLNLGDLDGAFAEASKLSGELCDQQFFLHSKSLMQGLALRYQGHDERARTAFATAVEAIEERVRQTPGDARVRSALGIAYAGSGRAEDAVREGELGVELFPASIDAYIAPFRVVDLVLIHTLLGQYERALDRLEEVYGVPPFSAIPRGSLMASPVYAPLRELPRVAALVGGG